MAWNSAMPESYYGTVACLVQRGTEYGVLSASHVFCPLWRGISAGARRHVRIALDDGTQLAAELDNWDVPMALDGTPLYGARDVALAMVSSSAAGQLLAAMALPTAAADAAHAGLRAYFLGATSRTLKRTIVHSKSANATMRFSLYSGDGSLNYSSVYVPLRDMIQIDALPDVLPGDSGCMLYDGDGRAHGVLVGTQFGPAEPVERAYPYFVPLAPVLARFGVSLVVAPARSDSSILRLIG